MAKRIDNIGLLDWDDSALIKAYNKGMSLRVKGFEKENNTAKENHKKSSKKKPEGALLKWRVGDHCRAIYHGDNLWYEAKIIAIDGDMCTVDFLGYGEEGEVELNYLDKSLGKKAVKMQKKNARQDLNMSDAEESATGDETRNDHSASYSPHHHRHHSRREHRRNNEINSFHRANYSAAESTFHNAHNVMRYPEMSTTMIPSAVPPCSEVVQNPSLNAMLTAWYMAGYYTGLHQAQKNAYQQHCHCYQAHNCHQ